MEKPRVPKISRDEHVGITADEDDVCEGDSFNRTLVGKIWTESPFNVRAFKATMLQAWRVKNHVDVQDLNKNLFLFTFASKREADSVVSNGPWNFDRNLVILDRVSGEEQPSDLEMNRVSFWVRIYDLPLKLRSEALARKLGNFIGIFEEWDQKDQHRMGKFLRVKVSIDLRHVLKRGTNIKFQGRDLWVSFKYERLPNFCFVCGKIGHQIKDCEEVEEDDSYADIEARDQAFGPWLRASPLPKFVEEVKMEGSSGTCSKSLFSPTANSKSKGVSYSKGMNGDEEVEQQQAHIKDPVEQQTPGHIATSKSVEEVAETLGTVALSNPFHPGEGEILAAATKTKRKWTRRKGVDIPKKPKGDAKGKGSVKRNVEEVIMVEGNLVDDGGSEKKQKGDVEMTDSGVLQKEVVLDDQHHRAL